jgi:hydroxymethylbilane synthase
VHPLRLGTRGSRLALKQSRIVADRLRALGIAVELVTIVADGDVRAPDAPIGEGIFVTALERALARGEIDLAVHSAKDLPLDEDPRTLSAPHVRLGRRHDPARARGDARAPQGLARSTDKPRRGLRRFLRPDLDVIPPTATSTPASSARLRPRRRAGAGRRGPDRPVSARAVERLEPDVTPPAPPGALAAGAARGAEAAHLGSR